VKEAVGRWPSSIGRVRNVLAPIFNLRSPGEKIKEELGQEFAELTRVAVQQHHGGNHQNNRLRRGRD
jgi:hypothetical protein